MEDRKPKIKKNSVLIISSVWVEPNSSAAGSRMLQLIHVFKKQNWEINYASTAISSPFAFDLTTLGINQINIELNNTSFDSFLTDLQPTIVIFDRFIIEEQFGWRVADLLPNTVRILDTEDLHCLRKAREIALKNKVVFKEVAILKTDIAKREIASILRCDLSLMISTYEIELLQRIFKIDSNLIHYIPFLLDKITDGATHILPSFEKREHFYFIGNFLHNPNYDSVLYIKKEIWPILSHKLPKAELHIYGSYPSQKVTQLNNKKDRFFIKGRLDDLNQLKQYKICLAPLRFGAGIKGKFIESMQNGTPNITTTIGAESMRNNIEWSGIVANSSSEIISASETLYTDKKKWRQSQKNGFKIINNHNKSDCEEELIAKIVSIQTELKQHRANNFMGTLLQHHTLRSTKYLSKWIEEKNKN